jgi:hypothetical protein
MTQYKKADNCGPVPYPDQSGKMLTSEIVEGDEWEPLFSLGFIVKAEETNPAKREKLADEPVPAEHVKPVILKEEPKEASDAVQINDGTGNEGVDTTETGKSSDEGVLGRTTARRRR